MERNKDYEETSEQIPQMPPIDRRAAAQLVPRELWKIAEKNRDSELDEIKTKVQRLDSKYNNILLLLLANLAGLVVAILQGVGK
jgi:hypothetical protein